MLGDIEEALGFLLFERNARGMQPTPLGVVTLAYARRALAELTRFAEDLDVKRKGGHGQLTVGAIMGAAPDLLAMAVASLKTERPLLNVRILGETSDQVVQLLHRRDVDLALGRLTSPLQHNDFSFEPLAREPLGRHLHRRVIAQQFLNTGFDERWFVAQPLELEGMLEEGENAVADQVGGGFVTGIEQENAVVQ